MNPKQRGASFMPSYKSWLLGLALACLATQVMAGGPSEMNYQGRLFNVGTSIPVADSTGNTMIFTIYDAATLGTSVWTETQTSVGTKNGLFNVILGKNNSIGALFDKPYWLEVTFNGQTMSPRQALVTAPYAFRATYADNATLAAPLSLSSTGSVPTFSAGNSGSGPAMLLQGVENGLSVTASAADAVGILATVNSSGGAIEGINNNGVSLSAGTLGIGYFGAIGEGTAIGTYGAGTYGLYGDGTKGSSVTGVFGTGNAYGLSGTALSGIGVGALGVTGVAAVSNSLLGEAIFATNSANGTALHIKQGSSLFEGYVSFTGGTNLAAGVPNPLSLVNNLPGAVLSATNTGLGHAIDAFSSNGPALYALNNSGGGFQTTILAQTGGTNHAVEGVNTQFGARGILAGDPQNGTTGVYGLGAGGGNGVLGEGPVGVYGRASTITANTTGVLASDNGVPANTALQVNGKSSFTGQATFAGFAQFNGGTNLSTGVPNPLSLSNGTATYIIAATNSGTGVGVSATATGAPAIYGRVNNIGGPALQGINDGSGGGASNNGVYGSSVSGAGIYGTSPALSGWGVYGSGGIGVAGVANQANGIGVLANSNSFTGALALHAQGSSIFDGPGNTTTFNTFVAFQGGTNLPSGVPNPLSLTGNAAYPGAVITASNTGNGFGVAGTASAAGVAPQNGPPQLNTQISAGILGSTAVSASAGVAGYSYLTYTSGAGVLGVGPIGVVGSARNDISNGVGLDGEADGPGGIGVQAQASIGIAVAAQGLTGVSAVTNYLTGTALVASANNGGLAVHTFGNSVFDGSGNTVTFNTFVTFTAGTNLTASTPNPLNLFNAPSGAVISGNNTGAGTGTSGTSASGYGVWGAGNIGVHAESASNNALEAIASNPSYAGVFGQNTSGAGGIGVYGAGTSAGMIAQGSLIGLSATANNQNTGIAVYGRVSTTASGAAVEGINDGNGGMGLYGVANSGAGYGVYGTSTSYTGVYASGGSYGVQASSPNFGVYGTSTGGNGIYGSSGGSGPNGAGVSANNTAVGYGLYAASTQGIGIYAQASSTNSSPAIEGNSFGAGPGMSAMNSSSNGGAVGLQATANSGAAVSAQGLTGVVAVGTSLGLSVTGGAVINGLRYPAADGPSGYVLTTNGSGQLNFLPAAGVSNPLLLTNNTGSAVIAGINTGTGTGVSGTSTSGFGVAAQGVTALAAAGTSLGISATAQGTAGTAIYAAVSSTGQAVYGINNGTSANIQGIFGTTDALGGTTGQVGVGGYSNRTSGYGIEGGAGPADTSGAGIYGTAQNPSAYGVLGTNSGSSGYAFGVVGNSGLSPQSIGVAGEAGTWNGPGVSASIGVYGVNTNSAGIGVFGNSTSNGIGVYGQGITATVAAGTTLGLSATAGSGTGNAIFARAGSSGAAVNAINDGTGPGLAGFGTANGVGVKGSVVAGTSGAGVEGVSGVDGVKGVWGTAATSGGIGMLAENTTPTAGFSGAALQVNGLIKVASSNGFQSLTDSATSLTSDSLTASAGRIYFTSAATITTTGYKVTNPYVTDGSTVLVNLHGAFGSAIAFNVVVPPGGGFFTVLPTANLSWTTANNQNGISFIVINQ